MSEENATESAIESVIPEDLLKDLSIEDLKKLMEKTRKRIKQQSKPSAEISPEKLAEIKPFEENYEKVQSDYNDFKKQMGEKLKRVRQQYKDNLAEAKRTLEEARDALNEKRKELGLRSSRASSAGPQMSWHIDVDTQNNTAEIGIKDKPETFVVIPISEDGRASIEDVREKLIKAQEIVDEGGGRARGVLNRIYAQYGSKIQQAQGGGTVPSSSKPESDNDNDGSENNDEDQ